MAGARRLLVYGMQSSGASTFCYFLGQRPFSIAIVDVWARAVAPWIDSPYPVVAKATVTTTTPVAEHFASFRPDRTILFVRDPVATYASLIKYPYANTFGRIEDKLAVLEHEFAHGHWDAIIRYEDFAARDASVLAQVAALGWDCAAAYWDAARSFDDIVAFNASVSPWCAEHFMNDWAFGNIRPGPIRASFVHRLRLPPHVTDRIGAVAPRLMAAYSAGETR